MKNFLLLIIIVLLIIIAGIYFGYINLPGVDLTEEAEQSEELVFESVPGRLVGQPVVTEDEEEVTVETLVGQREITLTVSKDEDASDVAVDIYGFSKNVPDVSGSVGGGESGDGASCLDACSDFCDQSTDECQVECTQTQAAVCDNADARLAVCNTGCSLIPPPFNIPCFDKCEDDFDDACSAENLEQCQDDCKNTSGQMCDQACSDGCSTI